jgi:hypothetical protein
MTCPRLHDIFFGMMWARCALLGAAAFVPSCLRIGPYTCDDASQCVRDGESGRCEMDGRCSFMDSSCASGWAYDRHYGEVGGTCVPEGGTSTGSSSSGASGQAAGSTSSGASNTGQTSGETSGETTGQTTTTLDDSSTGDTPQPAEPCPDDLPASYILCEDFEGPFNATEFFAWDSAGEDVFGICAEQPHSGTQALCVEHAGGEAGGVGDVVFAFGTDVAGGGFVHRPGEEFREVWLRFNLLLRDPWPAGSPGLGDFLNIEVRRANETPDLIASISLPGQLELPRPELAAYRCPDGVDTCAWGGADPPVLQGTMSTMTDLFDPKRAGQWTCLELHADLGSVGVADGFAEIFVDGVLDASVDGLLLLQSEPNAGINRIEFGTAWIGDAAAPDARAWALDDVIVSTARVACR